MLTFYSHLWRLWRTRKENPVYIAASPARRGLSIRAILLLIFLASVIVPGGITYWCVLSILNAWDQLQGVELRFIGYDMQIRFEFAGAILLILMVLGCSVVPAVASNLLFWRPTGEGVVGELAVTTIESRALAFGALWHVVTFSLACQATTILCLLGVEAMKAVLFHSIGIDLVSDPLFGKVNLSVFDSQCVTSCFCAVWSISAAVYLRLRTERFRWLTVILVPLSFVIPLMGGGGLEILKKNLLRWTAATNPSDLAGVSHSTAQLPIEALIIAIGIALMLWGIYLLCRLAGSLYLAPGDPEALAERYWFPKLRGAIAKRKPRVGQDLTTRIGELNFRMLRGLAIAMGIEFIVNGTVLWLQLPAQFKAVLSIRVFLLFCVDAQLSPPGMLFSFTVALALALRRSKVGFAHRLPIISGDYLTSFIVPCGLACFLLVGLYFLWVPYCFVLYGTELKILLSQAQDFFVTAALTVGMMFFLWLLAVPVKGRRTMMIISLISTCAIHVFCLWNGLGLLLGMSVRFTGGALSLLPVTFILLFWSPALNRLHVSECRGVEPLELTA